MEKDKQEYEPPNAMRLGDKGLGRGMCDPTGSGDTYCLFSGNSAWQCYDPGNSATAYCELTGNGV